MEDAKIGPQVGEKSKKRMEKKIVLPDTNIFIPALAKQEPYASFLNTLIKERRLAFSTITIAEYLTGASGAEEKIFNSLLSYSQILPVDLAVAQVAGYYRRKYREKKKNIPLPDALIAATCKVYRIALATFDKKGYPMDDIEIIDKF